MCWKMSTVPKHVDIEMSRGLVKLVFGLVKLD